jgi:hypothetical protein
MKKQPRRWIDLIAATVLAIFSLGTASAQTSYIDTNSVWTYFNQGTDPGANWNQAGFDDSTWSNGLPKFGFGGDGERTSVGVAANGITNFYFRHTFNVTGAAAVQNLFARYIRDDGVVVYLNGVEVFRTNMPAGPVFPGTQATAAIAGADETQFVTNAINPALLQEGANLLAVEVHQAHGAAAFSSDLGFYLELLGNLPAQAPAVTLENPDNGTIVQADNVTLTATASDVDGTVVSVEFYQGNTLIGADAVAPYAFVWTSVPPGTYTLRAVATDSQAQRGTSAPVTITVVAPLPSLVPFGANWRYLDNGTDQGTAWSAPGFLDLTWANGPAELGYGDGDEATVLQRVGDAGTTNITFYFRHTFTVANPSSITSLVARVVRDDGIILYLNGTEILRNNLTNAVVDFQTLAADAVEDEPLLATNVPPTLLVAGVNVLAAEVHQQSITSSDVSFDLQLIANSGNRAPVVSLTAPTNGATFISPADVNLAATAYDPDGAIANVQFFANGTLIGTPDMTVSYGRTATGLTTGPYTLTAVATDNTGLSSTSTVTIAVMPGAANQFLVSTNLVWSYLDDGSDPGAAWRTLTFDDAAWRTGRAELGFGDGDEVTVIRRTNDVTGATNITFYFRHEFTVNDPTDYTNLVVDLRRDDGGVVYINNTEVFRSNMTNGPGVPVLSTDFAGNNTGSETAFNSTNINPSVLVPGLNIIAVEIHQQNLTSSDVSFDLQLRGQYPAGPTLFIDRTNGSVTLSWFPNVPGYVLQEAPSVTGPWVTRANQSNPQTFAPTGTAMFFRLCSGCP